MIAHLHAMAFAADQPGLAQYFEVMGQRRFRHGPIADPRKRRTGFDTARPGDLRENRRTKRIGQRMENRFRPDIFECWVKQGSHVFQYGGLDTGLNSSNVLNYRKIGLDWSVLALVERNIDMAKLTGKVAVVTGASKGIGAAIAKALAKEGASVVVNYASSKAGAEAVVKAITAAGGKAVAVHGDVAKADQAQGLIDAAVKAFGRLDVLVNNSGVYEFAPIEAFSEAQYRRIFDINVLGVLLTTQAAARHLGEGGSVINISSAVTSVFPPNSAVYTGTKGAVDTITGVLANELGPRKIRVNVINPGIVETEGAVAAGFIGSDFERGVIAQTPLARAGQPDDIADVAVFLASDDARWLTGERINASGGLR